MNACFALPAQTTLRLSWWRRKRKRRKEEIYVCIYIIFIYLLGQQGDQTAQFYCKDWCWSWSSNTLATLCEGPTHWKRPWCWERVKAGGEGDGRGWDGWMALPAQWTWVWANAERWWRTGKPGVLQSMGSQGVRHNLLTEQQLSLSLYIYIYIYTYIYIFKNLSV